MTIEWWIVNFSEGYEIVRWGIFEKLCLPSNELFLKLRCEIILLKKRRLVLRPVIQKLHPTFSIKIISIYLVLYRDIEARNQPVDFLTLNFRPVWLVRMVLYALTVTFGLGHEMWLGLNFTVLRIISILFQGLMTLKSFQCKYSKSEI